MQYLLVEHQGQVHRVPVARHKGRLWFHWRGETYLVDVGGASRRSGSEKGKTHPGVIVAPMPGKITKVFAQPSANVKKGDPLVVMEAMKMEYTLEADLSGVVSEVRAGPGQQVSLGELLVKLSEATT